MVRVQDLGFRVQGLGLMFQRLEFSGLGVQGCHGDVLLGQALVFSSSSSW